MRATNSLAGDLMRFRSYLLYGSLALGLIGLSHPGRLYGQQPESKAALNLAAMLPEAPQPQAPAGQRPSLVELAS